MADKYRNKYRIKSTRAPWWDYSRDAGYFITICTKNRTCFFGEIIAGEMELSPIGEIVETEWLKTLKLRPDMNLELREYIVMPNHFHGIIIIGQNKYNRGDGNGNDSGRDAMHCVSTMHCVSMTMPTTMPTNIPTNPKNKFGPQSKNLASIIRGFKSSVTAQARLNLPEFGWQPRFNDHIIRDEAEYRRIAEYIINNPANWQKDKFYRSSSSNKTN